MRQLHDYRTSAIAMLRNSLATGHKRPMLQAATGSGKTTREKQQREAANG